MKCLIAIAVFIFYCVTLESDSSPVTSSVSRSRARRVVYGEDTYIPVFPWTVNLYNKATFSCGGSIIGEEWIVTAAHCVFQKEKKDLQVIEGSTYFDRYTKHTVEDVIIHPNHDPKKYTGDIALAKVSPAFIYNGDVQPVKLAESGSKLPPGTTVRHAGHGKTESGTVSKILKEDSLQILSLEKCKVSPAKKYFKHLDNSDLCVIYRPSKKGPCKGDSGGGLVDENKTLVGVVYGGDPYCKDIEFPVVFANISYYRDWIKEKTGI